MSSRYRRFRVAFGEAGPRLARPGLGLAQAGGGWLLRGRLTAAQLAQERAEVAWTGRVSRASISDDLARWSYFASSLS